jgi:RNA polymerase sigma factor (sigma-70 family)
MSDVLVRVRAVLAAGGELDPALERELEVVFADLRPTVLHLCQKLLHDHALGEEVAQDAIAEAWRKIGEYREEGTFAAWVCGFARNLCRNRQRKWTEALTEDGDIDAASAELDALRQMRQAEREVLLEEAIGHLPTIEQDVLRLFALGRSYAQIDAELHLDGTGARNQLAKARRHVEVIVRELLARRGHGSSFFRTTLW